jgi:RNA polymerase sigma factor (sigma-70 family)
MMGDPPSAAVLVGRALSGDGQAWDMIVKRFAPLVWSVCQRFRVTGADAEDVGGIVWLRLVDGLASLREPAALPGWISTVTQRECLSLLRRQDRTQLLDDNEILDPSAAECDSILLAEERGIALRAAFATLPERDRELLTLLFTDPPIPYATISRTLGIPIGAIGPTRARCLSRLRRTSHLAALADQPRLEQLTKG